MVKGLNMSWLKQAIEATQDRKISDALEKKEALRVKRQRQDKKELIEIQEMLADQERLEKARELRSILKSSGARKALDDVRREVWHKGKIEEEITPEGYYNYGDPEATIKLVHHYIEVKNYGNRSDGKGGHCYGGNYEDESSEVVFIRAQATRPYSASTDRFLLESGVVGKEYFPISDPDALPKIQDFLQRDSLKRVQDRRLPMDLKDERLKITR